MRVSKIIGFGKLSLCAIGILGMFMWAAVWALAQTRASDGGVQMETADPATKFPAASAPAPKADSGNDVRIRIQSNLVTTPVTVISRASGDYVYDLEKDDFTIYDNGVAQQIERFDREPHKLATVLVIQDNEAVAPLLGDVKLLAPLFSGLMLGPKGESAVLLFADNVVKAQDFSSSEEVLNKSLHSIKSDGRRARLNDALMQAMNLLEKRPKDERRVIVVISTGYDSGSTTDKDEVIRRATNSEVEIYGLGLSPTKAALLRKPGPQTAMNPLDANVTKPPVPGAASTPSSSQQSFGVPADITQDIGLAARSAQSSVSKNDVESYVRYTGGVFYTQWSSTDLQVHLSEIAAEIHSQYELAYVPDNLSRIGFHNLKIKVSRPGVEVRSRLGYYYAGPKQ